MAGVRTELGTGAISAPASTLSFGSTPTQNCSVIVGVVYDASSEFLDTVEAGGQVLSAIGGAAIGISGYALEVYAGYNITPNGSGISIVFSGGVNASAFATAWQGTALSPQDKLKTGSGVAGQAVTGAAATTSQANEVLIGFAAKLLSSLGGSWSGSFTEGQKVSTASTATIVEGYRVVSATGAYSATRTGDVSAPFGAVLVTLKLTTDKTCSLDAPAITATANSPGRSKAYAIDSAFLFATPSDVSASVAPSITVNPFAGARSGVADSRAQMGVPDMSKASTVQASGFEVVPPIPPGLSAVPRPVPTMYAPIVRGQAAYSASTSKALRFSDLPYFAAVQTVLDNMTGFNTTLDAPVFAGSFRMLSMPQRRSNIDEVHFLASFHEFSYQGREVLSMGVTPSGRLVVRMIVAGNGVGQGGEIILGSGLSVDITTPIGTVRADGNWHSFALTAGVEGIPSPLATEIFTLSYDGGTIASGSYRGVGGFIPRNGADLETNSGAVGRIMLYNGIDGITRCACEMANVSWADMVYPINEGSGSVLYDWYYDTTSLGDAWYRGVDSQLYMGTPAIRDGRLYAGRYDPGALGYDRPWPWVETGYVADWRRQSPDYIARIPVAPGYTSV